MRAVLVLCALMGLSNCGVEPRQTGGDILVIGDSVMAWNRSTGGTNPGQRLWHARRPEHTKSASRRPLELDRDERRRQRSGIFLRMHWL
jgi:hypothetical protein